MKNTRYILVFLSIITFLAFVPLYGMNRKQPEIKECPTLMEKIKKITTTQDQLENLANNELYQLDCILKYLGANRFMHVRAAKKIDSLINSTFNLLDKADKLEINNAKADTYCNPTHRKTLYKFLEETKMHIDQYFNAISKPTILQKNDQIVFLVPKNDIEQICSKKLASTTESLIKKLKITQLLIKHPNRRNNNLEEEISSINLPSSPSNDSIKIFRPPRFIKNKQFYPSYLGNDLLKSKRILILETWERSKFIKQELQNHGFNLLELSRPKEYLRKIIKLV